jgi:putative restriction endonuclease
MFAIAITDLDWFRHVRIGPTGRIVNFWTPTPWRLKKLRAGDRFYFMLRSPISKIGGYGTFVRCSEATVKEAWEQYGRDNGVDSEKGLAAKIAPLAKKRSKRYRPSWKIGCILLADPITFDEERYIIPEQYGHLFSKDTVRFKYFDGVDGIAVYLDVEKRMSSPHE